MSNADEIECGRCKIDESFPLFSTRIKGVLNRLKIYTNKSLIDFFLVHRITKNGWVLDKAENQLYSLQNFGRKSYNELYDYLTNLDIEFDNKSKHEIAHIKHNRIVRKLTYNQPLAEHERDYLIALVKKDSHESTID